MNKVSKITRSRGFFFFFYFYEKWCCLSFLHHFSRKVYIPKSIKEFGLWVTVLLVFFQANICSFRHSVKNDSEPKLSCTFRERKLNRISYWICFPFEFFTWESIQAFQNLHQHFPILIVQPYQKFGNNEKKKNLARM